MARTADISEDVERAGNGQSGGDDNSSEVVELVPVDGLQGEHGQEIPETETNKALSLKKPRKKYRVYPFQEVRHLLMEPKNLEAITELYINTTTDKELYTFIVEQTGVPCPYGEGVEMRAVAMNVYGKISPQAKQEFGLAFLQEYMRIYSDINFVIYDGEIHGVICFSELEPNFSGFSLYSVRGTVKEKARAVIELTKFWNALYLKHWHEKGYRYLTMCGFLPKAKEILRKITKDEKKGVFAGSGLASPVLYNGVIHWYQHYRYDLNKKYGT